MGTYSLTYIYHDCFLLETADSVVIFDYWKDPLSRTKEKDYPPLLEEIDPEKKIYILISHHHKDHFSRRIFLWIQKFPNITYIISKDTYKAVRYMLIDDGIYAGYRPSRTAIHVLEPGETFEDGHIKIRAFDSTDIGNSYVVELHSIGLKVFHAGDLNAWRWVDDSTEEDIANAEKDFTSIIEEIRALYPTLDIAMFPVDSRQGREYWWGAKHFVNTILTSLFVPMHFELVVNENEKEQRRIDAAAFNLFAREDFGAYLQLASTRSRYISR